MGSQAAPSLLAQLEGIDEEESGQVGWDDAVFVNKLDDLFRCPICLLGLRDPSMCPSQHIFCDTCLRRAVTLHQRCPVCKDRLTHSSIQPARFVRNMMDKLEIYCENKSEGCSAIVTVETLAAHIAKCPFKKVECPNEGCSAAMPARDLEAHRKKCPEEKVQCEHKICKAWIRRKELEAHSCYDTLAARWERERAELDAAHRERERQLEERFTQKLNDLETRLFAYVRSTVATLARHVVDIEVDREKSRANGIVWESGTSVHLPINGPRLLVSVPFASGVAAWKWKMTGNSSFEFGVVADGFSDDSINNALHTHGKTGFASTSTCGSSLPKTVRVAPESIVEFLCNVAERKVLCYIDQELALEMPLDVDGYRPGGLLRLAVTLWNGTRMERLTVDDSASLTPVVEDGECDHTTAHDECIICTSCLTCSGYGARCCVSGPQAPPGRAGRECGCGPGRAGCIRCGRCDSCIRSNAPRHPAAIVAWRHLHSQS